MEIRSPSGLHLFLRHRLEQIHCGDRRAAFRQVRLGRARAEFHSDKSKGDGMMYGLLINPVHTLDARHFAKMLGVMCDNGQTVVACCDCNENVKIPNSQSLTGKTLSDFSILTRPVTKWQDGKCVFNLCRLFQMLLNVIAMKSTVCKLRNAYLGSKDLFSWCYGNMIINPTAMAEEFNPCISVKNETFHKPLIVKVDFTVKRTSIIAMLHHLVVCFTFFRFRPNAGHLQELCLPLFCRKFCRLFFWHNQLICQPLTITLRERKPLQISPKIIQCKCCHKPIIE